MDRERRKEEAEPRAGNSLAHEAGRWVRQEHGARELELARPRAVHAFSDT